MVINCQINLFLLQMWNTLKISSSNIVKPVNWGAHLTIYCILSSNISILKNWQIWQRERERETMSTIDTPFQIPTQ